MYLSSKEMSFVLRMVSIILMMENMLLKSIAKEFMRLFQMSKSNLLIPLLTILSKEIIHNRIDLILGLIIIAIMISHMENTKIKSTLIRDTKVKTTKTTTQIDMKMNLINDLTILEGTINMEAKTITDTLSHLIRITVKIIIQNLAMKDLQLLLISAILCQVNMAKTSLERFSNSTKLLRISMEEL